MSELDALSVDLAFAAAWPGLETVVEDGWLLRAGDGVTRRANSALALGPAGDVDHRHARLVAWYGERGLTPRVQVVPSSDPALASELRRRGWHDSDGACAILAAPLGALVAADVAIATAWASEPSEEWIDVWWAVSPRGGERERRVATAILHGITATRRFALARGADGRPLACALGVVAEGLLVVESAATLPGDRRRGACRALVASLAEWAASGGALDALLSVELGNDVGRATWERLGFAEVGRWSYLVGPAR